MGDRRRPQLVHAQLVIDVSGDGGRSDRVIRDWFESGWRRLGHELRETADAQAVGASLPEVLCPFGVEVCLERVTEGGGDDSESDAYTPQEWQRFLGDLSDGVFKAYSLNASEREWVDEFNVAVAGGDWIVRQLSIRFTRYEVDGRTLALLSVLAPRDFLLADRGREDGLYRFFRDVAEQAGPLFGLIGFDYSGYMTGLEYALYLYPWRTIWQVDEVLRGYSWVTVVSDAVVDRLGGVRKVADGGAFIGVERLPAGGWLLRASAGVADYTPERAARVFEALRPVLPAGAYPSTFEDDWRPL